MTTEEIMETNWNFLHHVMEILTRTYFWEVYTDLEPTTCNPPTRSVKPFAGTLQNLSTIVDATHQPTV